jgi:hypothetical protein
MKYIIKCTFILYPYYIIVVNSFFYKIGQKLGCLTFKSELLAQN